MHEVDLEDPLVYADPRDDCDMILKGGITSGIVYPRAACRLAARYRFRRLGGTSAGAIAAAFVAAAEHGRAAGGFVTLTGVPDELGSNLAAFLQPSRPTRPAYALLTTWLEPAWGTLRRALASAGLLVRHGWLGFVVGLAAVLLPAFGVAVFVASGWWPVTWVTLVWLPLAVLVGLAAATVTVIVRTLRALPANGYGLCDGHTRTGPEAPLPLTDWMCQQLDRLAGLRPAEGPLTFGRLWGDDAVAAYLALEEKDTARQRVLPGERRVARDLRQIDFEVMTTNLTFRRPYRFPFEQRIFFFCERRLRSYFPDDVVDHLVARGAEVPDTVDAGTQITMLCPCHGERVRRLPPTPDLPVVVAVRISLSFPGLISALPLFCVDWSRAPGKRALIEAWFSDGGIGSNFPMHLFDTFWPSRPTFGINLQPPHPDSDTLVWRPPAGRSGILPRSHPISSMPGFLRAILDTMQNWVDSTQITLPGYRDRVVELRHLDDEGGINLKMPPPTIRRLADRGAAAAAELDTFDFDLHRWIRYRISMAELDELLEALSANFGGSAGYEAFLTAYGPTAPNYGTGGKGPAAADQEATRQLMDLATTWAGAAHPSSAGTVPRPKPSLRVVPRQ